jgi:putative transposase
VKTIKREYVHVSTRPNAASVLRQPDGWLKHYSTVYLHKVINYCSPRKVREGMIMMK